MSFSFNFNVDNDSSSSVFDEISKDDVNSKPDNDHNISETLFDAEEIFIDWKSQRDMCHVTEHVPIDADLTLEVVSGDSVEKCLDKLHGDGKSAVSKALQANLDVLPQVYEGGLKIWECSIDLVQYLSSLQIAFRGVNVLELGCGAGLPGLYAYKQKAHVTFQDYNSEVLSLVTAVNVLLNHPDSETVAPSNCRMIAGDWSKVQQLLSAQQQKYDYILTSETIYSPDSYLKLHDILKALLKPDGTIYTAAKTYYFGVGGGTRDFEDLLDSEGVFDHVVCKEYTGGVQREILKLTLKNAAS